MALVRIRDNTALIKYGGSGNFPDRDFVGVSESTDQYQIGSLSFLSLLPAPPPWLPIIAEGKHNYDLEYQLPTESP